MNENVKMIRNIINVLTKIKQNVNKLDYEMLMKAKHKLFKCNHQLINRRCKIKKN